MARTELNDCEKAAAKGIAIARAQLRRHLHDEETNYRMKVVAEEVIIAMAGEDMTMPHPDLIRIFMEEANCG